MEETDPKIKIGNLIRNKILRYELAILLVLVVATVLALFGAKSGILLTLFFTSLSALYFFSAFAVPLEEETSAFDLVILKIFALGSSIVTTGILFFIQSWPYSVIMLEIGSAAVFICLIPVIWKRFTNPLNKVYPGMFLIRALVLLSLAIVLFVTGLLKS
ncbi:MAG: hypothetical protein U0X39_11820 [Bacteroidales bacterium]